MNWRLCGGMIYEGDYPDMRQIERDVLIEGGCIVGKLSHDAPVVNMAGSVLLPALVNAHDHLELNHYPRTKYRDVYDNAHQWGEDVNARLNDEPFKSLRAYPLWDRLFIGGLKNLLCGATTVIQHGTPYRELFRRDYPVRVLRRYGWAHSLHFSTDEEVMRSYHSTPKDVPWFIHLAEGTDEVAGSEYERLKALGCLGANTVIVHGVGLRKEDIFDSHNIYGVGHGYQMPVVWCPTTNLYLLGKTGHPRMGWNTQLKLGSDSRLTADGDLLNEMRYVYEEYTDKTMGSHIAFSLATQEDVRWGLQGKERQILKDVRLADFIILKADDKPPYEQLCTSQRADLALVMRGGVPMIGDADMMARFTNIQTVGAVLDGVEKRVHVRLAQLIQGCKLKESGLELDAVTGRRWWWFR